MAHVDTNAPPPRPLKGSTVIITGGCSGIGYTVAKLLHSNGCNIVAGDLKPPADYHEPSSIFASSPSTAIYQHCDIRQWKSLLALFDVAKTTFGRIDIVCPNAGVNDVGDSFFSEQNVGQVGGLREPNLFTLDVNVKGTAYTVMAGVHYMRGNEKGGSIIMTASMAGYFGTKGMPLYTASKHGMFLVAVI